MQFLFLFSGIILGGILAMLYLKNKAGETTAMQQQQFNELDKEKSVYNERLKNQLDQLEQATEELAAARKNVMDLSKELAEQKTINQNLLDKLNTQKEELNELQSKFTKEFENLANKILDEKSQKFTDQNKVNLDIILNPLKEKITDFEKKVDAAYKTESAERNSLKGEIKSLVELNKQISEEANNLAKALKGDTKKQGNWGEMILEKILERSGLVKDREYKTQVSTKNDEGGRQQPDVVIFLPENKHVIIDAKVSLVAYEQFVNAADDEVRVQYLKEHVISVKNHVKILSEKNYQSSSDFSSPDFVLLFMPIESSFSMAVQADQEIFSYAWDKKIVIVSPSTLLATLRTISSIWKQERQTRNALEIAEQGGKLYDKFVAFTEDLTMVGKKMDEAKSNYVDAMKKLSEGRGNLVSSTEKLKELGAKSSKQISSKMLERSEENIHE
ncbi:MAG: DNA recombination protein RmuC [Bacteroidetes bacterium]|nr:DNA recombination protein RmuC [Bacteroidota bacterium]